jgi:hypothetical protein
VPNAANEGVLGMTREDLSDLIPVERRVRHAR